jgi:alkylhydroperoxidase family enzyme
MARIPFPERESLSPDTQRALASLPDLGIFRLLSLADDAFPKFIALTGGLWTNAELSPRRRELVILLVARLLNCEYEWFQHIEVARICEISDDEIAAIDALELASFSDDEQAILQLAQITLERGRPSDEQLAAARAALSDREVVELQLVVAIYSGLAAVMAGLDLELDERSGAHDLTRDERGPRLGE